MIRIRELQFTSAMPIDVIDGPADGFLPVDKLNLLVGPNNAGKSRLLRKLFSSRSLQYRPTSVDLGKINALARDLRDELSELIRTARFFDFAELLHNARRFHQLDAFLLSTVPFTAVGELAERAAEVTADAPVQHGAGLPRVPVDELAARIRRLGERHLVHYRELTANWTTPDFVRVYVPVLRGARPLGTTDLYLDRTKSDYFPDHHDSLNAGSDTIFTGQSLYGIVREKILGDYPAREDLAAFAAVLADRIFRQAVTIVARQTDGMLTLKIGDRPDRAIHELGDGIQQIVILLFAAWFHRHRDLLLFIDEPELFLHPTLQRALTEIFSDDTFPRTQIFATTHSNHILDRSSAASYRSAVFMMAYDERAEYVQIRHVQAGDRRLLEALGVMTSSVFLTNCTIWVEGITDRMYLKRYLELVGNTDPDSVLIEDVHYSFVEYSGSNLEHWTEIAGSSNGIDVTRLCARMIVIADSDEGKEKKHERLRGWLDDRYIELPCREIENLLSEHVLRTVVEEYEKGTENIVSDPLPPYTREPLGTFIDAHVLKDVKRSRRYRASDEAPPRAYAERSGTIKTKVEFARVAVAAMHSIDVLTAHALELTRRVRAHILANNRCVIEPRT